MNLREKMLRERIAELQERLISAESGGETESYLSFCRFRLDDAQAALNRELELQARMAARGSK